MELQCLLLQETVIQYLFVVSISVIKPQWCFVFVFFNKYLDNDLK